VPAHALQKRVAGSGRVDDAQGGWRLSLPAGDAKQYRLAQLDDYAALPRRKFPHQTSIEIKLKARSSHSVLPGTWGFGLWNDPFGFSLGFGGSASRLPALPNAVWFFFASSHSHLSLNQQPGAGQLVGAYQSPQLPSLLLAPGLIATPLLLFASGRRWLRSLTNKLVHHELTATTIDPTAWHEYQLCWQPDRTSFHIDGQMVFTTTHSPRPPLGLVLWLDNQFAAWKPDGSLSYGLLSTPADCWVEIADLQVTSSN
jgi:hypothetical protein